MQQFKESRLGACTIYEDGLVSRGAEVERRAGEYGLGTSEDGRIRRNGSEAKVLLGLACTPLL